MANIFDISCPYFDELRNYSKEGVKKVNASIKALVNWMIDQDVSTDLGVKLWFLFRNHHEKNYNGCDKCFCRICALLVHLLPFTGNSKMLVTLVAQCFSTIGDKNIRKYFAPLLTEKDVQLKLELNTLRPELHI